MSKKISELPAATDPTGSEKYEVTQSSTSKAMTAQQLLKATLAVTASGTDTYTATPSPALTAYTTNDRFYVKFTNANTGAATLNLNSLGAKSIVKNGSTALSSSDISAGQILELVYDGTNFQIVGGGSGSTSLSGGSADRVAYWTGANALSFGPYWDNTNTRLGIGESPTVPLLVSANGTSTVKIKATAGAADVILNFERNAGTTTDYSIYAPAGSTDLRFYSGSDRFTFTSSGVFKILTAPTNDNTETSVLVRQSDGEIQTRDASTLGGSQTLDVNTTQVACGASPGDLYSYSVPGSTMDSDGDTIIFTASGTFASNGNSKAIQFAFGGVFLGQISGSMNGTSWKVVIEITRTSATTQKYIFTRQDGNSLGSSYGTTSLTLSSSQTLQITASTTTAASDSVKEIARVVLQNGL